jgi:hypothetical protein
MTRASVAVAFALMLFACHEEPTIVIKFEPNDLGQKAADLATARVDMTAPRDLAGATAAKTARQCKTTSDCTVEPVECCDCNQGGKLEAVSKKQFAKDKAARVASCKGIMCPQFVSNDPSCSEHAECVDGACVLAAAKKKAK